MRPTKQSPFRGSTCDQTFSLMCCNNPHYPITVEPIPFRGKYCRGRNPMLRRQCSAMQPTIHARLERMDVEFANEEYAGVGRPWRPPELMTMNICKPCTVTANRVSFIRPLMIFFVSPVLLGVPIFHHWLEFVIQKSFLLQRISSSSLILPTLPPPGLTLSGPRITSGIGSSF